MITTAYAYLSLDTTKMYTEYGGIFLGNPGNVTANTTSQLKDPVLISQLYRNI